MHKHIHKNTPAHTHKEQRQVANLKTKETLKTESIRSENKDQNIISRSADEMNLSLKRWKCTDWVKTQSPTKYYIQEIDLKMNIKGWKKIYKLIKRNLEEK